MRKGQSRLSLSRQGAELKPLYMEALTLVERLHRRLLDVIKDEFDRAGRSDVNSVQALLLFNIGDSELTAGELRTRGYYLGSNVSYNLKKLVEMGYIHHQRSRMDRRSVRVSLTEKGREVADIVNRLYERHIRSIDQVGGIGADDFHDAQPLAAAAGALLDRPDPLPALIAGSRPPGCHEKPGLVPGFLRLALWRHCRSAAPREPPHTPQHRRSRGTIGRSNFRESGAAMPARSCHVRVARDSPVARAEVSEIRTRWIRFDHADDCSVDDCRRCPCASPGGRWRAGARRRPAFAAGPDRPGAAERRQRMVATASTPPRSARPTFAPRRRSCRRRSSARCRRAIAQYSDIVARGGWPLVPADEEAASIGMRDPAVAVLRQRLAISGDLPPATGHTPTPSIPMSMRR